MWAPTAIRSRVFFLTDDQIKAITEKATVERLVDHMGLGSDFDGTAKVPEGLEDVTRMPNITKVLVARGYPEEDIKKILGENHLRIFKEILH